MGLVALLEIDFPSGTRRYSFRGVRSPSGYYTDRIQSLGEITYEFNPFSGALSIGDLKITLENHEREFSVLRAQTNFLNVPVRVKFGDIDGGLAALRTLVDARLSDWRSYTSRRKHLVDLSARDHRFGRFRFPVTDTLKTLNLTDYPNMPANVKVGELIPLPYGNLVSTAERPVGQIPAYLVDPAIGQTKYRYALAQGGPLHAIVQVYRYEEAIATPTVTEIDGVTYLDFSSDQRATRSFFDKAYDTLIVGGAVSRWLLNEGSGGSVNDEDDSNDGSLEGGASWHTASYGKKFVDLNPGYIDCGRPANLNLTGDMTIVMWADDYYEPYTIAKRTLINNGEELDVKGWAWYWTPGHELEFRTNTSGANQITRSAVGFSFHAGESPSDGNFSFLALRKASGVVTMYVDGQELAESFGGYDFQPTHTNPATPTANFLIGDSVDAVTMKSSVGHVRIFSSALTDAQIKSLAQIPFAQFTREDENEISADVEGMEDDIGDLITNPAEQLRDFLENRVGVDPAENDDGLFTTAAANCTAAGYEGAFALIDKDATYEEILVQFAKSWNMPLIFSKAGKYGPMIFHAQDYADPADLPHFRDSIEVLAESFEQYGPNVPASSLLFNHSFQWIEQLFESENAATDSGQVTALGQDIRDQQQLDLWHVRDGPSAAEIAGKRLELQREESHYVKCALPISLFDRQLAEFFRLSHKQGIDSGSEMAQAIFRNLSIRLDLDPRTWGVSITAVKETVPDGS